MTHRSAKYKLISASLVAILQLCCETRARETPRVEPTKARDKQAHPETRAVNATPTRAAFPCPMNSPDASPGAVTVPSLHEISGLVASRQSPGVLWVHNDSGGQAHVYALSPQGEHIGTALLSTSNQDWEDIAIESSEDGGVLYVADTGDNLATRSEGIVIHRFTEPSEAALRKAFPKLVAVGDFETMRLRFPEGPTDAEALLVDPLSDEIVLISKPRMRPPKIYSVPRFQEEAILSLEGIITEETSGQALHLVTGADVSADGRWIVVRTYTDVMLFERSPGMRLAQALLGRACPLVPPQETQGEAIAFLGAPLERSAPPSRQPPAFVTISEGVDQALHRFTWSTNEAIAK